MQGSGTQIEEQTPRMTEIEFLNRIMAYIKIANKIYSMCSMEEVYREINNLSTSYPEYSNHMNVINSWLLRFEADFLKSIKKSVGALAENDASVKDEIVLGLNFYSSVMEAQTLIEIMDLREKLRIKHEAADDVPEKQLLCLGVIFESTGDYDYTGIANENEKSEELKRLSDVLAELYEDLMITGMRALIRGNGLPSTMKLVAFAALSNIPEDPSNLPIVKLLNELMIESDKLCGPPK